ncbi:Amino acid transporter, partial [Operophtera brumata]
MLLLPLILITQIRYLKFLVPFSILANLCLMVTFCITCYYTFVDLPELPDVKMVESITKWPLFLSTAIFAMEGVNVVMPVENEMARPQRFLGCPGVLTGTMALVALLYGVVGVFGYLKYGDRVLGTVFFTYCLQMYAPMDILWTRIKGRVGQPYHNLGQVALRTASVVFTVPLQYCLQMYAPMDILWTRIKGRVGQPYHNLGQVALRTASVIFTVPLQYCLQMYAPMAILWTRIKGRVGQPYHNLAQVALRTVSIDFT